MTNIQEKTVYLVYKKLGETPKECIERYKIENPQYKDTPMTYVGRLDPMAEGLLVLLSGNSIENKDSFLNLPKTYIFKILWGFETDTGDILGLVSDKSDKVPGVENVKEGLEKFLKTFTQKYPAYSSKPVKGKPLFQWAREGSINEIEIPEHEVSVYNINFMSREEILNKDLFENISKNISLVSGDFRQKEIVDVWKNTLEAGKGKFFIDKIEISVSSGFYVRQFIVDLAHHLYAKGLAYSILRTKVGDYELL